MTKNKSYIVSLKVSFDTPTTVSSKNDTEAKKIAKENFKKKFDIFKKTLDDISELCIDVDYVEEDECFEED